MIIGDYKIRPLVLVPILGLHIGAVCAILNFSWAPFITTLLLWVMTGMIGISVGYHRLFAHRAFKTYRVINWFHAFCGIISFQQGPLDWVRIHRAHHTHSDDPKDPHYQGNGLFFGHMGWPFLGHKVFGRSDIVKRVPTDLEKDPVIKFLNDNHLSINVLLAGLVLMTLGLQWFYWIICFRIILVLHLTWSVNSVTHRWGTRPYKTKDTSTNNLFVALLTFGEGWHNNHHRFPSSPRLGLKSTQIDFGWWWIWGLERLGLAWDLKRPRNFRPEGSSNE